MGFFTESKTMFANSTQTSSPAFLADFSGALQLKNTKVGLTGSQEMHTPLPLK